MPEQLQEYWILIVVALVIAALVIWWLMMASRKTAIKREETADEEGGTRRNQALIDAPAASVGPVTAAANSDRVAAAPATADAEAGAAVPAREAIKATETAPPAGLDTEEPTPAPAPAPAPASSDDLRRIKGLGPKLVTLLGEQGVTNFAQIAAWDDADIDRIDAQLGRFQGRIRRDNWVEQAKLLAADDIAGYEAQFGNL